MDELDDDHAIRARQMVVIWRVQEACSLSCRFCGYSRELNWPRRTADPESIRRFGRVLSDVQDQFGRSLLISWLGGEPLSWSELPEISRYFCHELNLLLGVTTNGLPLALDSVRAALLRDYSQLTISIDGLESFHDQVRGQPGLFRKLRRLTHRIRRDDPQRRLLLRVNTVLMRGNIAAFDEFCEVMADWGFDELTFNQLGGNERPEFFAKNRLLPDQVSRFVERFPVLQQRMSDRGLTICGGPSYLQRILASTNGEAIAIDDCRPGSAFFFIDTQGRISPCSFTSDAYGIPIGEIQTAAQFLSLAARFRERRRRRRSPVCADCHATHLFDKFTETSRSRVSLQISES